MSSPQTTANDLSAVAEAIRSHDRFLVTTHENPDGDALGSLLARSWRSTRSARTRSCTWPARRRCRASTRGCRSTICAGRRPTTQPSACCSRSTARTRAGSAPTPRCSHSAPLVVNVDHHHDNSRFGAVNLVVADASSTGEIVRDLLPSSDVELTPEIAEALYIALVTDTGRFQYTNTTPKALRLAAELVEAGADVHKIFQDVYESVQFAKLKLLGRGRSSGRRSTRAAGSSSRISCAATSPRWARRSRTRRGSSTTCAPSRARTWRR